MAQWRWGVQRSAGSQGFRIPRASPPGPQLLPLGEVVNTDIIITTTDSIISHNSHLQNALISEMDAKMVKNVMSHVSVLPSMFGYVSFRALTPTAQVLMAHLASSRGRALLHGKDVLELGAGNGHWDGLASGGSRSRAEQNWAFLCAWLAGCLFFFFFFFFFFFGRGDVHVRLREDLLQFVDTCIWLSTRKGRAAELFSTCVSTSEFKSSKTWKVGQLNRLISLARFQVSL